jgi:hypothetical protein
MKTFLDAQSVNQNGRSTCYCICGNNICGIMAYLSTYCLQMLAKKVDTLNKAMEVEAKKMRREIAAMEKEFAAVRLEKEQESKAKRLGNSKGPGTSQMVSGRYAL